jgi:hypothetical protein
MKLETRTYKDESNVDVDGNLDINIKGNTKLQVGEGTLNRPYRFDVRVEGNTFISQRNNFELISGENNLFTAVKNTDIYSNGNHTESAARIDMNTKPAQIAKEAEVAATITDLPTHANIVTDGNLVWAEGNYGADYQLESIMKRVPMHEPWPEHENLKPAELRPADTDREGES